MFKTIGEVEKSNFLIFCNMQQIFIQKFWRFHNSGILVQYQNNFKSLKITEGKIKKMIFIIF